MTNKIEEVFNVRKMIDEANDNIIRSKTENYDRLEKFSYQLQDQKDTCDYMLD